MSSAEQYEAEVLKNASSIRDEVKKLNEVLKDSRIAVLAEELDAYAGALYSIVTKSTDYIKLEFHYDQARNYKVYVISKGYYIGSLLISESASIRDLFNAIFTSSELREKILTEIFAIISKLASEVAERADLVERVRRLEEIVERHLDP
jgi:FMN phosphatase YigB (HAD superfamily)